MSFGTHGGKDHFVETNSDAEYPSKPPYGTKETPQETKARQAKDIEAVSAWRNRT